MAIVLPDLPYSKDDLAPYISANTLDFHHGKHHNAYVTNLNKLIAGTDMENLSLEDIIIKSAKDPAMTGIFN
ncbi:MAG: superoxide dismutase [Fe], partial [Spirochaetes bacterium]|nr:superoxide dismutase [Fe] [Spirochaetota bacterium]